MKKILLGTTALVAATAFTVGAAQADAAISGSLYQQFGGAFDADGNYGEDEGLQSYSTNSLQFTGGSTLDNGAEMAFTLDFSTVNGGGTIDEFRFSLADSWGKIQLGADDPVADILDAGTPAVSFIAANSGTFSHLVNGTNYNEGSMFMGTYSAVLGDTAGIHYYSPDIGGLTLGLSYNNATPGALSSGDTTINDVASLAGIYSGEMGDVGVSVSAGVEHVMHLNNKGAGGDDTANRYRAAADVVMGGISVGIAYGATDYNTTTTAKVDNWSFAAGASYNAGAHTIGIDWVTAEANIGGTTGDTDGDTVAIGYAMSLGGGVSLDAGVAFIDVKGRTAGSADDVDATVFGAGMGVSF